MRPSTKILNFVVEKFYFPQRAFHSGKKTLFATRKERVLLLGWELDILNQHDKCTPMTHIIILYMSICQPILCNIHLDSTCGELPMTGTTSQMPAKQILESICSEFTLVSLCISQKNCQTRFSTNLSLNYSFCFLRDVVCLVIIVCYGSRRQIYFTFVGVDLITICSKKASKH